MNGDRLMYFQHTDISRVVFEGYVDDDEIMMCDNIVNAMEKPEKKTSLLRKLDEKKKECAERDAKQQAVKKKRNYEMSL